MQMRLRYTFVRTTALAAGLTCLVASAALALGSAPVRPGSAAATGAVRGVVWTAENSPLPNAKVRLRNLQSGRVESEAVTTERGEFVFEHVPSASFLTEVVDEAAKVVAVGQSFRIESGEAIATFVRIPARRSWLAGVFSNTASAVIAAASSAGITAVGSKAPPASPQ
jgi:hypothetical protein